MANFWTDEELKIIKTMWAEGKTAIEISKHLNDKSRSSVLAKARRLKLASRANTANRSIPRKRKNKQRSESEKERVSKTAFGDKCSLADLRPNQCCWPVGDPVDKENFGFCAAKKDSVGHTYCSKHLAIAYS